MIRKALSLSIVIPVYNEQSHLKACLDSIAKQEDYPDEVIVVDNNSTDKTCDIAKSYPFVKLAREKKQGVLSARTKGFNLAKSDFIGRIDADTVLPPTWIKDVKKSLRGKRISCSAQIWQLKEVRG
jgi:glycosyltransferase involved in cell wall biosynthesis